MIPAAQIHDSSLRDAVGDFVTLHLRTHELGEVLRLIDRVGFGSVDGFGGATAERLLNELREDPWDRLRSIRRGLAHTPLQAVVRGRMFSGTRPAPAGTIRAILRHFRNIGVDILKVSDPGLDSGGVRMVVESAKALGFRVNAAVVYSWGQEKDPLRVLLEGAQLAADAGADEVTLQDPMGLLSPAVVERVVAAYGRNHTLPLRLHIHDLSLLSTACVEAAIRAGAAAADATVSSVAWSYSPPRTESLVMALRESPRAPRLDGAALAAVSAWFEEAKERKGFRPRAFYGGDAALVSGGLPPAIRRALSDELRRRGHPERSEEATAELLRVWKEAGHPPLLTPFLETLCSQAALNVISAARYETLDPRMAAYLGGLYGPVRPGVDPALSERAPDPGTEPETELPDVADRAWATVGTEEERLTVALFPGGPSLAEVHTPTPMESALTDLRGDADIPRRLLVERQGEAFEVVLEGIGPGEGGKRVLFLRIGGETATVEVTLPPRGSAPAYALTHHGKEHRVKVLEILGKGKRALPVLLREDDALAEVLYSFPKSV